MDAAMTAWVSGRPHEAMRILAAAGLDSQEQMAAVRGALRGARKRFQRVIAAR